MNTTDQAFIRAYGSDFIPSYADEAARAADYPALADCNVNAVFGSLPRPRYRVDGPAAIPSSAATQIQGGNLPAPLPPRPYLPRPVSAHSTPSAPLVPRSHEQVLHAPAGMLANPPLPQLPNETDPAQGAAAIQHQLEGQAEDLVEPPDDAAGAHGDMHLDRLPPSPAPAAGHLRVPRPHLNFAAVNDAQPQPADVKADVAPQSERPPAPATPVVAPARLNAEDGLSILADSSVLINSTLFEWPVIEPSVTGAPIAVNDEARNPVTLLDSAPAPRPVANEPAAVVSQPAIDVAPVPAPPSATAGDAAVHATPVGAAAERQVKQLDTENASVEKAGVEKANTEKANTEMANTEMANTDKPGAAKVTAENPGIAEVPLNPAIANIDKEATGAAMQAEADEPVTARQKLKPAWEVDRLQWPADAELLYESESEYFRHAGEKLRDASQEGLRVLGVCSTHDGEGCTTLAICLARAAAAAGAKVALVDANLRSPRLGAALGLNFARSWHEVLNGKTPLAEAAVTAIADNVTLIPLSKNAMRQGLRLDSDVTNGVLGQAGEVFDLVLVDIGSPCDDGRNCFQAGDSCPLDAAIVVRDVRTTSEEETLESVSRLRALGIDAVGIAENFASSAAARAAA